MGRMLANGGETVSKNKTYLCSEQEEPGFFVSFSFFLWYDEYTSEASNGALLQRYSVSPQLQREGQI